MSLFKNKLLNNYNLMEYKDDFLLLHCSKNDFIYAPFDGKLEITDNGCGFEADDAVIAFDKHATSKIKNIEDLQGYCNT